jgi:hypothetical protein
MIALGVALLDEFPDGIAQMVLAEWNDVPEALLLDSANKSLGVRVEVWAVRRQSQ